MELIRKLNERVEKAAREVSRLKTRPSDYSEPKMRRANDEFYVANALFTNACVAYVLEVM